MKRKSKVKIVNEFATRDKISLYERFYTSLPDPDKILQANGYNYDIYRDLLTDPHLQACIQQRKMQVMQMGWEVENMDDEQMRSEAMEIIKNLEVQKITSDILDCIFFGYTVGEIKWVIKNGKYIPVDLVEKPQEWFMYDRQNKIRMRKKTGGSYLFEEGEQLPEFKFIVSRYQPTYTNPYGEKILSRCYWPVTFKRSGLEQWHLLSERYGVPYLVGFYPVGATSAEQDALKEKMEEMIGENIVVMPDGTKIEFKENSKYEIGQLFQTLCEFHNKEISKAVLSSTLTVEVGRSGSYKASAVHQEMLSYLGIADKKLVELAINKMLKYYSVLNYGEDKEPARIKLQKKEYVVHESESRDKTLTEMGIEFTKEYYMKRYNLSGGDFVISKAKGESKRAKGETV